MSTPSSMASCSRHLEAGLLYIPRSWLMSSSLAAVTESSREHIIIVPRYFPKIDFKSLCIIPSSSTGFCDHHAVKSKIWQKFNSYCTHLYSRINLMYIVELLCNYFDKLPDPKLIKPLEQAYS